MKENWECKKLGEIASFNSGSRPTGGVGQLKDGALSLGGEHIGRNGRLDLSNAKYVSCEYYESNAKGHVIEGDILLCKDGALTGKVAIEQGELHGSLSMVNEHIFIIRTNDISQRYLFYYLFSPTGQSLIQERITGSAQGGINGTQLKTIPISYPVTLQEQVRIVSELDLLRSIIDKQKAELKELDNLAQSTFYDMFGDPIENPKGWDVKRLGDICDVRDGTHDSPDYVEVGYPLVTSKNVVDGTISFENVNYINEDDFISISKRSKVDDGDIIMPMIGTIGKPVIVCKTREFAIKNVALIKFYENCSVLNVFIRAIISSESFDAYMKTKNKGGTQKFIALGDIRKLNVPVPPISLQQGFADKIASIEKQKAALTQSIAEMQKLLDYSMDKYFG